MGMPCTLRSLGGAAIGRPAASHAAAGVASAVIGIGRDGGERLSRERIRRPGRTDRTRCHAAPGCARAAARCHRPLAGGCWRPRVCAGVAKIVRSDAVTDAAAPMLGGLSWTDGIAKFSRGCTVRSRQLTTGRSAVVVVVVVAVTRGTPSVRVRADRSLSGRSSTPRPAARRSLAVCLPFSRSVDRPSGRRRPPSTSATLPASASSPFYYFVVHM